MRTPSQRLGWRLSDSIEVLCGVHSEQGEDLLSSINEACSEEHSGDDIRAGALENQIKLIWGKFILM